MGAGLFGFCALWDPKPSRLVLHTREGSGLQRVIRLIDFDVNLKSSADIPKHAVARRLLVVEGKVTLVKGRVTFAPSWI